MYGTGWYLKSVSNTDEQASSVLTWYWNPSSNCSNFLNPTTRMAEAGGGCVPAGWDRDAATGKLRPVKGEVLSFSFGDDATEAKKGAPSLQDGFKGFRKAKLKAARNRAAQEEEEDAMRKEPAKMLQLRELFIERCKSYYGVPYHKKYHGLEGLYFQQSSI
jgi:hypothetical protein